MKYWAATAGAAPPAGIYRAFACVRVHARMCVCAFIDVDAAFLLPFAISILSVVDILFTQFNENIHCNDTVRLGLMTLND